MSLLGSRNASRQQKNEHGRRNSMTITKRRANRSWIKNRTTPGPPLGRRPSQLQKTNSNKRGGSRRISPSCRSCCVISTARTKHAIGRFDSNFTRRARGEPECAARRLNNRAAGTFVWIVHKLVEPNLRRRSNTKVALVMKLQAGLARASGFYRFVGVNTAASRKSAADTARRFRCD